MHRNRWATAVLILFGLFFVGKGARAEFFSLEEAIRRARVRAPAAVDARGASETAKALGEGARVSILGNPSLEVTGEHGKSVTKDVNIVSSLFLPVEVSGQRGARISEWKNLVAWHGSMELRVRAEVTAATAAAYGGVLVARARLDQAEHASAEARSEAAAYKARLAAGDATAYDVSVFDSEAARYQQIEVAASASLARAIAQLAELTGGGMRADLPADTRPPSLLAEVPQVDAWVKGGPVVDSLSKESRYWASVRERAEADRISPLVVIATGGRGDYGEARIGGGLGFAFPVFRRNQGEIARAEAERTRALRVAAAVRASLVERARGALSAYRSVVAGIGDLDRTGIPAAERAAEAAAESQRAGKAEMLRVIIARRDLAAARSRRLDLVELAWSAYSDLAAIKGDLP
jgi:cobalt-zinc-cadmium efflux system outer membrane protein